MEITETKILRGPNQWSVTETKLIELRLENDPSETEGGHPGLPDQFYKLYPELRLPESGEDLPAIALVFKLALKLQQAAGIGVESGFYRRGSDGTWFVAYAYEQERTGTYAGEAAVMLINAFYEHHMVHMSTIVKKLLSLKTQNMLGATSAYILEEARKRGIPFSRFNSTSLFLLGYGNKQKKLRTAVSNATSGLGIEIAGNKEETRQMLLRANIPVPQGIIVYSEQELRERMREFRLPVVVKPLDGNQGRGVTTHINTVEKAVFGFETARKISDAVIMEEHIQGDDYRLLVVNYKLIAAARRIPAQVKGDGRSSIRSLIQAENDNPERGDSAEHVLAKIKVDASTFKILSEKGYSLDTVPAEGEVLILKETANISAGGTAEDVTDQVHSETRFMAERIARLFELDICGIDAMTTDITQPLTRDRGAVIEVNAGPGIRMHSNPQKGKSRNVAAAILDMLFPDPGHCKIPVVAVTGTNGKTTTTRLVAFMAAKAGFKPGFCTSQGIYINNHRIFKGDCTGYRSGQDVLFDPTIDLAVLECARGGIIRSGLAFDECDVSIVTNISEDHLGLNDINTLKDLARIKAVVPQATKASGYAVLNADDDLVYSMAGLLKCRVALFSMNFSSERIRRHCANGGTAAFLQDDRLMLYHRERLSVIGSVATLPLSFNMKSAAMIKNMLAACLAGTALGFSTKLVYDALKSFEPSAKNNPGRMNIFNFRNFRVMVDYAHNSAGFEELGQFMEGLNVPEKTVIIALAGDRRDEDFIKVGQLAGRIFDRIIIRHDKDNRGRDNEEQSRLLILGVRQSGKRAMVSVISDETQAIEHAVNTAKTGSFIVVCADDIDRAISTISALSDSKDKNSGNNAA
jgi:cyanophycin synthetase